MWANTTQYVDHEWSWGVIMLVCPLVWSISTWCSNCGWYKWYWMCLMFVFLFFQWFFGEALLQSMVQLIISSPTWPQNGREPIHKAQQKQRLAHAGMMYWVTCDKWANLDVTNSSIWSSYSAHRSRFPQHPARTASLSSACLQQSQGRVIMGMYCNENNGIRIPRNTTWWPDMHHTTPKQPDVGTFWDL